jgi:hypothetical protein
VCLSDATQPYKMNPVLSLAAVKLTHFQFFKTFPSIHDQHFCTEGQNIVVKRGNYECYCISRLFRRDIKKYFFEMKFIHQYFYVTKESVKIVS